MIARSPTTCRIAGELDATATHIGSEERAGRIASVVAERPGPMQ